MTIKLYPSANETIDSIDEIVRLLRQAGCACHLAPLDQAVQSILVEGNLGTVGESVRDWLNRNVGRTAHPASLCDTSLHKGAAITTLEVHQPDLDFA